MEISSRQIVALGAPLIVTYLTWSAVSGEVAPPPAPKGTAISTASASKRPEIGALARNPFAPASQASEGGDPLAALDGEASDAEQANTPLKLDGTVVTGRWRMAIINGERVFEGQSFRGRLRLEEVTTSSVTLVGADGVPVQLQLDIAPPPAPPSKEKKPGANAGLEALMRNFAQAVKEGSEPDGGKAPAAKKPGGND